MRRSLPVTSAAVAGYRTGVIANGETRGGSRVALGALLALPLVALVVALLGSGILAIIRGLTFLLLPAESTSDLLTASLLGCVVGAITLVGLHVAFTGSWRLRELVEVTTLPRSNDRLGVSVGVFVLLAEAACLAVASWRGHGTLTLVSALVAGQVALLWAVRVRGALFGAAPQAQAQASRVPGMLLAAISLAALLMPILFLAIDDDARRPVLPFAALVMPIAVGGSVALVRSGWRRRGPDAPAFYGVVVEVATLLGLAVLAAAPI